MKNKAITFMVGVLFLGACLWFLWTVQRHTMIPRSIKLTDCTNSTLEFSLRLPMGRAYNFVLATPNAAMALKTPYLFAGKIRIFETTNLLADFPIGSETTQQCNWLEGNGIAYSLILTSSQNTNSPILSRLICGKKDYQIKIEFSQPPPHLSSLWLCWVQAYKDR